MSLHRYQVNELDQELENRLQEQSEHEDFLRSGLSMHEASHMTPAQIHEAAVNNTLRKGVPVPLGDLKVEFVSIPFDPTMGRQLSKTYTLADGRQWLIWDAHCMSTPVELRAMNWGKNISCKL